MSGLPDSLALVGTTIADKYSVESVVGEGGFAIVYRATHLLWKRPVAVKVFKALGDVAADQRDKLLEEFIREGSLLAELSERSAAIVQARDVGMLKTARGEQVPYMVLEWLEGASLESVIADERSRGLTPRTVDEMVHLLDPAAEALALAHVKGIAHRDVKPANVFVLGDPRGGACTVKLLDFGIAKVVQDAQKMAGAFAKTSGQVTSFTPAYGAPEQFTRTHGATGPWTDVFALALVGVEVLTQKDPLDGDDFMQLAYSSSNPGARPTPRARGANVPDAVEAVFAKALAVKPQDRHATAGEFWNALRAAVHMKPLRVITSRDTGAPSARVEDVGTAPTVNADSLTGPRASMQTAPAAPAPKPPVAAIAILGGLGVLLIGGFFAFSSKSPPAPAPASSSSSAPPPAASSSAAAAGPAMPAMTCPEGMLPVPGGEFYMGSDDGLDLEKPAHHVMLSPFCIDRFEVTLAKYKECSDRGACKRAGTANEWEGITAHERQVFDPLCNAHDPKGKAPHPVNCVDWEMASHYCDAQAGGRLPTEAEWEFAARGPDGRKYPWGDEIPSAAHLNACGLECLAWGKKNKIDVAAMYQADDGYPNTAPVGSFPQGKSRYGLEDVVGNVWEWVGDWYATYPAAGGEMPRDPKGPVSGTERVIRGGAWNGRDPAWVRPTFRFHDVATKRSYGIGFRCAKSP
jgi:formylglycine-generating enzyme required for sulfatase activity